MKRLPLLLTVSGAVAASSYGISARTQSPPAGVSSSAPVTLSPTSQPPLPGHPSQFWFVPDVTLPSGGADEVTARAARGIGLVADGDAAAALPLLTGATAASQPLAAYAQYALGVALADLNRLAEADAVLAALVARQPQGALREVAALRWADVAEASGNLAGAELALRGLAGEALSAPAEVFDRLGRIEEAIGHPDHAIEAYRRIHYQWPVSPQASAAQQGLTRLGAARLEMPRGWAAEVARAEALFSARQWAQARAAFVPLAADARGEDRALVALRVAESDHYLRRHRAARDGLRPFLNGSSREAEARFFDLTSARALGDRAGYVALARALVKDHPNSEWAAETLNNLATHYIALDEDEEGDRVLRDLLERFPTHRHAERAAWKVGWLAYRKGQFKDTVHFFERAAASFPRADNRPAWLYWSGRARDQLGDEGTAMARYRLVVADYQNSYYGRLALEIARARRDPPVPRTVLTAPASAPPARVPTDGLIRSLAAAGLYDEALQEVQYAQRVWGDSAPLQATTAWLRHRQGAGLVATARFSGLRGAITVMRRAYPQFMAAGGETLPPDILRIIFPLDYWPLITKYAAAQDLDPFLVAALMAQESTFTAEIRSAANAYGLMQVIPSTGRSVARQLGMRGFTVAMLRQPEPNVRIGTQYFKDLLTQFGGAHFALAGYNAGPHRVVRWRKEAPGVPPDEFVDNIPFAETQAYVKRILGTAEDYRRLYDGGPLDPNLGLAVASASRPGASPSSAPSDVPVARSARPSSTRR